MNEVKRRRALKVELTITDSEGPYSANTVAETTLVVPLPASGRDVAAAVEGAIEQLNANVERFHGPIPFTATAIVKDDLPV